MNRKVLFAAIVITCVIAIVIDLVFLHKAAKSENTILSATVQLKLGNHTTPGLTLTPLLLVGLPLLAWALILFPWSRIRSSEVWRGYIKVLLYTVLVLLVLLFAAALDPVLQWLLGNTAFFKKLSELATLTVTWHSRFFDTPGEDVYSGLTLVVLVMSSSVGGGWWLFNEAEAYRRMVRGSN